MIDLKRQAELREAIELFFFAYRDFTGGPDRILEQRGLGRVHHRVLYFVGRNAGIDVGGLLRILDVSKQALNAPLRQMVEMDLVSVRLSDHDRRFKELRLTSNGAKLEAQLTGTQMKHLAAVFRAVGSKAEAGWRDVMKKTSS